MIAAILGNGPSRVSYFQNKIKYDTIVGCNIPWTDVDYTIILDEEVVARWKAEPNMIKVPAYFSVHSWEYIDRPLRAIEFFEPFKLGIVKPGKEFDTSGHVACSLLISKGYKEIDVYGADVMFSDTLESRSHDFFKNHPDPNSSAHIRGWRNRWQRIVEGNPDVIINFRK
jgi:hypothetical protein